MLADAGIGYLDAGICPFYARLNTTEGKNLDNDTQSRKNKTNVVSSHQVGDSLQDFMSLMVKGWFEFGLTALQSCPADIVLLCGSTSALVYSSICESLNVPYAVADDAPIVETMKFSPPRGFPMSEVDDEGRERQWRMHAESMWQCLFEQGVNECRQNLVRIPINDPRGCSVGKIKTRIVLSVDGVNDCQVCGTCRSGSALLPIVNTRGPIQAAVELRDEHPVLRPIPFLLFYSPHLLERPSEWDESVVVAGALIDADECLNCLPNPTDMIIKVRTGPSSRISDDDTGSVSSLSSGSDVRKPNPVSLEDMDDVISWRYPSRSNSSLSSLIPDQVYKFLFRKSVSQHGSSDSASKSSVGSLSPFTLIPTVYVDLGFSFTTWGNATVRGLVLQQCVSAARASCCRLILVADSTVALPLNLLSQHPSVEWTEDKSSRHTRCQGSSTQVGDLGPLVRMMCEDVLVLRRPIGTCEGVSSSRAAASAVAMLSRCSGVIGHSSSWLVHTAALAGAPLTPVDFQRTDSSDAFWAAQLHQLRVSPVSQKSVYIWFYSLLCAF